MSNHPFIHYNIHFRPIFTRCRQRHNDRHLLFVWSIWMRHLRTYQLLYLVAFSGGIADDVCGVCHPSCYYRACPRLFIRCNAIINLHQHHHPSAINIHNSSFGFLTVNVQSFHGPCTIARRYSIRPSTSCSRIRSCARTIAATTPKVSVHTIIIQVPL